MRFLTEISILSVVILLFAWGCKKYPYAFDTRPQLRIVSAEPTTLQEFQDSLIVVLEYKDGDGDLGFEDPDSAAVYVQDERLAKPDKYFVKPLTPKGAEISIQGTFRLRLRGTFIFGNANKETTRFTMKIRDQSGRWSEEVSTPEITIVK